MRRFSPHTASANDCDIARSDAGAPLSLSAHTYFCQTDSFCVFLDLEQDRYISVRRDELERLAPHLYGWSQSVSLAKRATPDEFEDLAKPLVDSNLLARNAALPKPVRGPEVAHARRELSQVGRRTWPLLNIRGSVRVLRASSDANRALKRDRLDRTIARVRDRKQHGYPGRRHAADHIRSRSIHFSEVRGYFPRSYLCLFDSLALVNYLASYRIFPDWVFGVRTDPFEAHCWVQHEDIVLNDTLDRINTFTPIMVV